MDFKRRALNVAGIIFLLVSISHLVRLIFKIPVVIGSFTVPVWYSFSGFVVAFLLSLWMFKSIKS
ncbi:MAG: hypothetical protein HY351_04695 [Candidatus Omnitrophica bacterium]|nr:hypothetical protein [Candidatus Omnitrophota bacterium]